MSDPRPKRRYSSPQRQEQAQQTRRKIVEAARRLFAAQGYAATTLPAIARAAGVSAPTITAVFGTKAALLEALINLGVRGDAADAPLVERPWWREMLAEPDPRRQLRLHAANIRRIQEASADIAEIVRGAATADPEIATMLKQRHVGRFEDTQLVAQSLDYKQALAPGVTVARARDLVWALSGAELYRMLVVERGWSPDEYEQWLAAALADSLLPHPAPAR
jgi:AcrR family transcriptional regulator